MLIENVAIDRVNLRIDKVTYEEWEEFVRRIGYYQYNQDNENHQRVVIIGKDEPLCNIRYMEKFGITDYRHNYFITDTKNDSDGAVFIGYHHNSSNPSNSFSMKIEFNPSKCGNQQEVVLKALNNKFNNRVVKLIECDVAIDIPYKISDVYAINTKGKTLATVDTTRYFGKKHTDMYLKVYDKLKEQGIDVSNQGSEHLTRVEFTLKPNDNDGLTYQQLERHRTNLNNSYRIGLLSDIEDFELKCVALAVVNNNVKMSEVPRYLKDKLKQSLIKTTNKMNIDIIIKSRWKELIASIKDWFMWSANYSDNYALFGTEERDLTEDEQLLFNEFMSGNSQSMQDVEERKQHFEHKKNLTNDGNHESKIS